MSEITSTQIFKDYSGEGLHFRREQRVDPLIEDNKQAEAQGANDLKFGRRFAQVPMVVLEKWIEEGVDYRLIGRDPEMLRKFKRKLADPEWRYFRTHYNDI